MSEIASTTPFVVFGPMVRRVDRTSVTVVVGVREHCQATLRVFPLGPAPGYARGAPEVSAAAPTVRLGESLHVVAVTVRGTFGAGALFGYDLDFGGQRTSLLSAGVVHADPKEAKGALAYPGGPGWPSFPTPPDDPNKLRVFHGSCRRPHAEGKDLLPALDHIVRVSVGDPLARPHQMIMTGDQIYADNVADPLLVMIQQATAALGMAAETLPAEGGPADTALRPGLRRDVMQKQAHFTSGHCDSHLMSFREYVGMYLMVWSDVLWTGPVPRFEDVFPEDTAILKDPARRKPGEDVYRLIVQGLPYRPFKHQKAIAERFERWREEAPMLEEFREGLSLVRRALANVPTYMVFDDHDVSDDWNIGTEWITKAVIADGLGRRVVRNALAAYAVFQHWGNTPDRFADGTPGRAVLGALERWLAAPGAADDAALRTGLGLPLELKDGVQVKPPAADMLAYHYTITWPRYQLVVLDTRTWRRYVGNRGVLLLDDGPIDAMVGAEPPLGDDAVTIVAQPTAFLGVPAVEQIVQPLAKAWGGRYAADAEDAWFHDDASLHKMVGRLCAAAPKDADGVRRRRLVLLGGDVHYGFAERSRYSAVLPYACGPDRTKPYEGENRTEAVLATFVASALRNEDDLTKLLHKTGYGIGDVVPHLHYVGWSGEDRGGARRQVGVEVPLTGGDPVGWSVQGKPSVGELSEGRMLTVQPEWRLATRFVRHDEADPKRSATGAVPVGDPTGKSGPEALAEYLAASRDFDGYTGDWGSGKEIVGYCNLGELSFSWGQGEDKKATQTLWWHLGDRPEPGPLTTYEVNLDLGPSLTEDIPYGFVLREFDHDANASGPAVYDGLRRPAVLTAGKVVEKLQKDLLELGFLAPSGFYGTYDTETVRAVREFQTYARRSRAAREDGNAARYSDRLHPVDVPDADRYVGPVSGVADLPTQLTIAKWKRNRWRCPVVVEGWRMSGTTLAELVDPNVWGAGQVSASTRLFARDIAGPAVGPAPPGHPELTPLGSVVTDPSYPDGPGPVLPGRSELLPEHLLPRLPDTSSGPTLAQLVARRADEHVAKQLSTFKVLRAVAEATAGAWFDAVTANDAALLRLGPFGWAADGPFPPVTTVRQNREWSGELWAYIAFLRATDRDAFDVLTGGAGLVPLPGWGADGGGLLDTGLRIPRSRPTLTAENGKPGAPLAHEFSLGIFRDWHWMYRFAAATRTDGAVRRSFWKPARQRLHDLLAAPWDGPAAPATVGAVPGADGNPRPARVGDLFTSERAAGMLACLHLLEPGFVLSAAQPGAAEPPESRFAGRAATPLHEVLNAAKALGPDFSGAPNTWTGDHETALITALARATATRAGVAAPVESVRNWPAWPTGTPYTLPIDALPPADRNLSGGRNSLRLDTDDLPRRQP
ncbi:peptidoglycan-binding protein [Actinomadura fibrosa]|uniref:Peptidoglycan-binding protein n=1 Tax=Actinomadura fibrosa TaxID=111802 RepID=A0ABW2XRN2_9ACTN|nr:peptidoglycan-binding protein [Actinomadura fibrosa]